MVEFAKGKYESGIRNEDIAPLLAEHMQWDDVEDRRLWGGRVRSQAKLRGWQRPLSYDPWALTKERLSEHRREKKALSTPHLLAFWTISDETEQKIRRLIPGWVPFDLRVDVVQSALMALIGINVEVNLSVIVDDALKDIRLYDNRLGFDSIQSRVISLDAGIENSSFTRHGSGIFLPGSSGSMEY